MIGMYTCPERVERDGWLVAFEGETMTMEEAASRGLVPAEHGAEEPERTPARSSRAGRKTAK